MIELEVEIYGKNYLVRGDNAEKLQAIARYVDEKLKEVLGREPRPIDSSRAIALALNFAEEIYHLQKDAEKMEQELSEKLDQLIEKLQKLEKLVEL